MYEEIAYNVPHREILSGAAVVLTFALFVPYIRAVHARTLRPHVFSWVVWGVGTLTVFFAQLAGNAGIGAWPIGISGLITLYIALLSYRRRGDTLITRSDWVFFVAALSAYPAWAATADPLWAVVILTLADLVGFAPTVRRAVTHPHQESARFFGLAAFRNVLVVLALETYSPTTVLFPAAVGVACLLLTALLLVRRRIVAPGMEWRTPRRAGS